MTATMAEPIIDHDEVRLKFWNRRISWGLNLPDHIFLGDAVLLAGQKMFREEWRDDDPAFRIYPPLSGWYNIDTDMWMIRRACELLVKADGSYRDRVGNDAAWNPQFPTQDEWLLACELSGTESTINRDKADRFAIVCREICGLIQTNVIRSFARPFVGGDPTPMPPSFWFTEAFWQRFNACRCDLDDPFQTRSTHATTHLLYVDRHQFSALIQASEPMPTQSAENEQKTDSQFDRIKRGRPPAYHWDGFNQEVIRRVAANGMPGNIREFAASMLSWCQDEWGEEPAESTVRGRLSKLLPTISG